MREPRPFTELRPREREVLLLHCREGLTVRAIARQCVVSENTVKKQILTAHERLTALDPNLADDPDYHWGRRYAYLLGYEAGKRAYEGKPS